MRNHLILLLLIFQPIQLFGAKNNLPMLWPVSMLNTDELTGTITEVCSSLNTLKHGIPRHTQSLKHHHCTACNLSFTTEKEEYKPLCPYKNHTRRVVAYYSTLIGEGVITGAKAYLFLCYLYNLGLYKASAQIGINFLSNAFFKTLLNEKGQASAWKTLLRQVLASVAKRGAKVSLMELYPTIEHDLLFEPNKMYSFVKGSTLHSGSDLADCLITATGNLQLQQGTTGYHHIKYQKRYELMTCCMKGFGIICGALVAQNFLEEPLNHFAELITEHIKDLGPEILKEVVSFTK